MSMVEQSITGVLHDRTESFGYGTCSKYLACSIECQALYFRIQAFLLQAFLQEVLL